MCDLRHSFLFSSLVTLFLALPHRSVGNPDAKRLYDDIIARCNKVVRPVVNDSDALQVKLKLKLSQLIDVDLRNQIMTTSLWLEQYWKDPKLVWDPREYGSVDSVLVPSGHIWRPDIVLYNNADGNFEVVLATQAKVFSNGMIEWKPPAIYKSHCTMNVEFFPFDEQMCLLKFGSWTYDGFKVDLRHFDQLNDSDVLENGVDLSEYYFSGEWDIVKIPTARNARFYPCCNEPYVDITFNITLRRKTLFYTANLIIPFTGISFLTALVFLLPSGSEEKISLCISILFTLTVFFLLLAEIIPPTSLVVPLLGKCVLFTMILNFLNICATVVVLNIHFRSGTTHKITPWQRRVFIHLLPGLLRIQRPDYNLENRKKKNASASARKSIAVASTVDSSTRRKSIKKSCSSKSTDLSEVVITTGTTSTGTTTLANSSTTLKSGSGKQKTKSMSSKTLYYALHDDSIGDKCSLRSSASAPIIINKLCEVHGKLYTYPDEEDESSTTSSSSTTFGERNMRKIVNNALFIANHCKKEEELTKIREDWKFIARVIDRLLLYIVFLAISVGTCSIILQAPTLYDEPTDVSAGEEEDAGMEEQDEHMNYTNNNEEDEVEQYEYRYPEYYEE